MLWVALKSKTKQNKNRHLFGVFFFFFFKQQCLEEELSEISFQGVSVVAQWLKNLTRNHEVVGSIPWPCSVGWGSGVAMSCGVGCRYSSDPELLWLWCRQAATALIRPLAWEPPCAAGVALEEAKKDKKEKKKKTKNRNIISLTFSPINSNLHFKNLSSVSYFLV